MKKQAVLAMLDDFPDEFDSEALMERLYLIAKIERAEVDIKNGNVISQEDFEKETQQWFK